MTRTHTAERGNLPVEPNSFIGRERDLHELALLLGGARLLTLCGPGGIGKTRLALRLARAVRERYPDGLWLVQLGEASRPAHVARRVAEVLGIREEPGRSLAETLAATVRGRQLALILDTCEHLVDPCAALTQHLLAHCPKLSVIATSREPLRVPGETVWRVPPLELPRPAAQNAVLPGPDLPGLPGFSPGPDLPGFSPGPGLPGFSPGQGLPVGGETGPGPAATATEAVRLFADRAAAARSGFALTAENAEAVGRLCRLLDGVPLALELAAARVRALSVEQIAARLGDQSQLLSSSDQTAPLRQQTLRAAIDWSFELLSPLEQILLQRVSVFSGWTLEMAEAVCSGGGMASRDVPGLLASLVDKSLVTVDHRIDGNSRYRLLDTMRQYAAHLLAESGQQAAVAQRHRDYMVAFAEAFAAQAFKRGGPPWPERLAFYRALHAERANLSSALSLSLENGEAGPGLRLCSALTYVWIARANPASAIRWFDHFLALPGEADPAVRGQALARRGELALEQQDYAKAGDCAQMALTGWHPPYGRWRATALRVLAQASLGCGDEAAALTQADRAIRAARSAHDPWEEGLSLTVRAAVLSRRGSIRDAQRCYLQALEVLDGTNGWGTAQAHCGLGSLARDRGDAQGAMRQYRAALALFQEIGAPREVARCLAGIGRVALAQGDLRLSRDALAESLLLSLDGGSRLTVARCLEAFAALTAASGDLPRAAQIAGAALVLLANSGHPDASGTGPRLNALLDAARLRLGAAALDPLLAAGRAMSMGDAAAHALAREKVAHPSPAGGSGRGAHGRDPASGREASGEEPAPAGQGAPAFSQPRSALTRREQEIAALVGRGLTNRAIAGELVISQATVARHVANILLKLGFSSRTQIAAWTASWSAPTPDRPALTPDRAGLTPDRAAPSPGRAG